MPVLLVLLTFVTLLLIDHSHSRKQVVVQAALQPLKREVSARLAPAWWADFEFRKSFTIIADTPGHRARVRAWFVSARTNLLPSSPAKSSASPCPGAASGFARARKSGRCTAMGAAVDMVSPIESSVGRH